MGVLMQLWYLFISFFASSLHDLGNSDYLIRERGSATLTSNWPVSAPAIYFGINSTDTEVSRRCVRMLPEYPDLRANIAAVLLVLHAGPYGEDGLPWADEEYVANLVRTTPGIHEALTRFVDAHKLRGVAQTWIGDKYVTHPQTFMFESEKKVYPIGLEHIRFRWRGIPDGWKTDWTRGELEAMREEWAEIKKKCK